MRLLQWKGYTILWPFKKWVTGLWASREFVTNPVKPEAKFCKLGWNMKTPEGNHENS